MSIVDWLRAPARSSSVIAKTRIGFVAGLIAPLVALSGMSEDAMAAGQSTGRMRLIDGVVNSEDIVGLPGTKWVVSGGVKGPGVPAGQMFLINAADNSVSRIYPANGVAHVQDRSLFGACPGAPDIKGFDAHGLNVRPLGEGRFTLYVTNNGDRASVEIFNIDTTPKKPKLTWTGCVLLPPMSAAGSLAFGNSVAPLPDGAFAVTLNVVPTDLTVLRKTYELPTPGKVVIWRPGKTWEEVPGSDLPGDNGIEATADGKWLYVTADSEPGIYRLSLGKTPVEKAVVKTDFQPDNIRWGDDGLLYIAGINSTKQEILDCVFIAGDTCSNPYKVVRIDPKTLHSEQLLDETGSPLFGLVTGITKVGDEIWLSSYRGTRIAAFPLK